MQTRLLLLLMVASLIWPGGAVAVEQPRTSSATARRPKATSYVSLVARRGGDRALAIGYPWSVHRGPSIEIRLVTGKDVDPRRIQPLFFVSEYMKGEVTVAVYRCRDEATDIGVLKSLTEKGLDFHILGRRNWLGKPSVCVIHPSPADDPVPGTAAVYCLLQAWALDKRLLYLDLPREGFQEPGKMYVWFLRQDKVLWSETVDWPGYEEQSKDEPAEPPADGSPAAPAVVD